jgi:hypothetical protein
MANTATVPQSDDDELFERISTELDRFAKDLVDRKRGFRLEACLGLVEDLNREFHDYTLAHWYETRNRPLNP